MSNYTDPFQPLGEQQMPFEPPPGNQALRTLRDVSLVLGTIVLLIALIAGFTWWVRSKERKKHYTGRELETKPCSRAQRRRRRRRRSQRANPTLAEVGGLPPKRTERPDPAPPRN